MMEPKPSKLNAEHRAVLKGMENAFAYEVKNKLAQWFKLSEQEATTLTVQWINEVEKR